MVSTLQSLSNENNLFADLDGEIEQLVTLVVDNQVFGIPILQVQDIVEPKNITSVPRAPSFVCGVLNLRGRIVTVIDLQVCMGKRDKYENYEGQMSVTVEYEGDLYTLLIDDIGDVLNIHQSQVGKVPKNLDDALRDVSSGIVQLEDELLSILSVPMLFKRLEYLSVNSNQKEGDIATAGGRREAEYEQDDK
ncbi:MAG: chemotaxis protein CheW [Alphaproteobacteria bacterium]|nr:chemotaxis protein CheW [Alphaproteobacteria bacterium]